MSSPAIFGSSGPPLLGKPAAGGLRGARGGQDSCEQRLHALSTCRPELDVPAVLFAYTGPPDDHQTSLALQASSTFGSHPEVSRRPGSAVPPHWHCRGDLARLDETDRTRVRLDAAARMTKKPSPRGAETRRRGGHLTADQWNRSSGAAPISPAGARRHERRAQARLDDMQQRRFVARKIPNERRCDFETRR